VRARLAAQRTPERSAAIVQVLSEARSVQEVRDAFGVTQATVYNWAASALGAKACRLAREKQRNRRRHKRLSAALADGVRQLSEGPWILRYKGQRG